jgi:hypothetical protein
MEGVAQVSNPFPTICPSTLLARTGMADRPAMAGGLAGPGGLAVAG